MKLTTIKEWGKTGLINPETGKRFFPKSLDYKIGDVIVENGNLRNGIAYKIVEKTESKVFGNKRGSEEIVDITDINLPLRITHTSGEFTPHTQTLERMTKGGKLVVLNYTPLSEEQKENIKSIKQLFANLIDDVEDIENGDGRLKAMVQTKLEDTCMYFVKLLANPITQ